MVFEQPKKFRDPSVHSLDRDKWCDGRTDGRFGDS